MILPFYTDINYQEFRKFIDDQDLLRQIKFFSDVENIPAFVYETKSGASDFQSAYIVYIDDFGDEISRTELTNNEIFVKHYNGQYLYISNGENLGYTIEYCKYYIEIVDNAIGTLYSEILTKIREQKPDGRLMVNTGGFINLNTGGYILLNDATGGFILDELTKIEAETSKNYGGSDFSGVKLTYYCETRPYLEDHFEVTEEEDNAGEITVFQKVITSVYSLEFFVVGSVMANLENLAFFDNILITDQEGREYNVVNRPEISRTERVGTSGVYKCTITFRTEYRIDLQLLQVITTNTDEDMVTRVGSINYAPSQLSLTDFLTSMNTFLANSGFKAVACDGQTYDPDTHPIAAIILGTKAVDMVAMVVVPKLDGLILVASGSNSDSELNTEIFTSGTAKTGTTYKHKLTQAELNHIHGTGWRKDAFRAVLYRNKFHNPEWDGYLPALANGIDLSASPGGGDFDTGFEVTSDLVNQAVEQYSALSNNGEKLITTRNDDSAEMLTERIAHNNMQPCIGAHAWTIIDDIS